MTPEILIPYAESLKAELATFRAENAALQAAMAEWQERAAISIWNAAMDECKKLGANPSTKNDLFFGCSVVRALPAPSIERGREIVTRAERYEKLRRLNVQQFAELYKRNISEGIPFDDLVDQLEAKHG